MNELIFQIYFRVFSSIVEVNIFLAQFPKGELDPINIEHYQSGVYTVYFKTSEIWSTHALDQYGLKVDV